MEAVWADILVRGNFLRVVFQLPPIALRRVSKYNTPSFTGVESKLNICVSVKQPKSC